MARINVLNEDTYNKIAAGEVVERASSVIKELVENSIDAGASNIVIEVEDSGNTLIRISDDGEGIHPDDISLAFQPHGTSKINTIDDVFAIKSFGFRGEALPSIASIARVNLISRKEEFPHAMEISIDGGTVNYIKEASRNRGTTVEVRDLFYNVPARQKFLKSPQRENSIINDLVQRLALGNYRVSFKLINNGKEVLVTHGSDNIKSVLREIYGKQVYDNAIYFEEHSDIISVYGYIGNREISRGSRNRQSIFVNNRLVKSSAITAAVENAFKSFIMINKFPFFLLYIDIFPEYLDPNVHPTKSEVKFFDDREVFSKVFHGVHNALKESLRESFNITEEDPMTEGNIEFSVKDDNNEGKLFKDKVEKEEVLKEKIQQIEIPIDLKPVHTFDNVEKDKNEEKYNNSQPLCKEKSICDDTITYKQESEKESTKEVKESEVSYKEEEKREPKFPPVRIIGQFNNSYIIGECNRELYLIDQHAAHEKVLFEKYKKSIAESQVVSQVLLIPVVFQLTFDEYGIYVDNKDIFAKCGFQTEDFGDNAIVVREVPMFLGKPDIKDMFYKIIESIATVGKADTVQIKYNKIASISCKAAVKANDKLSQLEMEALVEDLRYIEEPFTCPHGRPSIIRMTLKELEKKFNRIQ